jgi:NADPH:quinone reductase-like Zn-dependent oxidoreductase
MALAVGITEPGGPEVLRVIERDVPGPGSGEVRVAVDVAAVHPSDIAFRIRGIQGVDPPWVPGWDAAGVVESVGAGVEGLAAGDQVMVVVGPRRPEGGAQSELVVAPAASVVPLPQGVSPEQASMVPMNGLTALQALELLGLDEGATLLVTGGAGLLGSFTIALAKRAGLRVLADASPADEDRVRSYGADVVLPRGDSLAAAVRNELPDGVDGVVDTALLGRDVFPAIRAEGALVFVRGWTGDPVEDGIAIRPVWVGDVLERTDWLRDLSDLAAQGSLPLREVDEFPPERVADAHRLMEAGGLRRRAVLRF